MENNEGLYQAQKRVHKLLAVYLVIVAWKKRVDCVVVTREQLFPFLGLTTKMEKARIARIVEDVKDFFPYVRDVYLGDGEGTFAGLYFSRHSIPESTDSLSMSDEERASALTGAGLKTNIVDILPTEAEVIKEMACMIHGLD